MSSKNRLHGIMQPPDLPIFSTIQALNDAHKRIILVVDPKQHLLGVVTDSDIRHSLLKNTDMQAPVSDIMQRQPVTVAPDLPEWQVLRLMEQTHCYQIPVVNGEGRLLDIHFIDEILLQRGDEQTKVAVVMAGGLGSRLRPLTENTPKSLLSVGDKPLLFVILDHLIGCGFNQIYLTLNYQGEKIKKAVSEVPRFQKHIHFLEESKRMGTAGPLHLLPSALEGPFVVMNGDLLTKVAVDEMLRFHINERNMLTVALREQKYELPYGVAKLEGTRILGMVEKPAYIHFINTGIYIMEPAVLDRIPADEFFDMPMLINDLIQADLRVGSFPVHEYWLDIGVKSQLEQARLDYHEFFK